MTADPLKTSIASGLLLSGPAPVQAPAPLVMDCPHSGRDYPVGFRYACDPLLLRQAEDNHVDTLLADTGFPLLIALFPRTYIDVNRAADDIEDELLAEPWPGPRNPSPRAGAGAGLIRRVMQNGLPVYDRKLNVKEIQDRIDKYYIPYHQTLKKLLDETYALHGRIWHMNWHSMPDAAQPGGMPDFVLGDFDHTSCDPDFTYAVQNYLHGRGYSVALNHPYKGAELITRYSDPARARHSLQIEINKRLYWDEKNQVKTKNFNVLKGDIDKLIQYIAGRIQEKLA